jgi:hypothetical protein
MTTTAGLSILRETAETARSVSEQVVTCWRGVPACRMQATGVPGSPATLEEKGGDALEVADGHEQDQGLGGADQRRPVDGAVGVAGDHGEGLGEASVDQVFCGNATAAFRPDDNQCDGERRTG